MSGLTPQASAQRRPEPDGNLYRLLDHVPGVVFRARYDDDRTVEFMSQGARTLTGFAPKDLEGNRVVSLGGLMHPDDRGRVRSELDRGVALGTASDTTYRIRRADGSIRWVRERSIALANQDGSGLMVEGYLEDVTEQRRLTEVLDTAQERLKTIHEQSLAGVYCIVDHRFEYVNPRLAEIFGYTPEELLRVESVLEVVHPEDRVAVSKRVEQRVEGNPVGIRHEFRGIRKDGSICHVEVQGRTIEHEDRRMVVGLLQDLTERELLRRRHHEMEKLETVGRVAGGIAHDFNNVLQIITFAAEDLLLDAGRNSDFARNLRLILDSASHGRSLSTELMRFGKTDHDDVGWVSVGDTLEMLDRVIHRSLGMDIDLVVEIEPDLPALYMSPTHVEQIVMNLVGNARDALPRGGTIELRARRVQQGPKDGAGDPELRDVPHLVLSVRDNGTGIDAAVIDRIFEPYFTTKADKGTGLGLGNVWRIAALHGGAVEVDSMPEEGTEFRVFLPIAPRDD